MALKVNVFRERIIDDNLAKGRGERLVKEALPRQELGRVGGVAVARVRDAVTLAVEGDADVHRAVVGPAAVIEVADHGRKTRIQPIGRLEAQGPHDGVGPRDQGGVIPTESP